MQLLHQVHRQPGRSQEHRKVHKVTSAIPRLSFSSVSDALKVEKIPLLALRDGIQRSEQPEPPRAGQTQRRQRQVQMPPLPDIENFRAQRQRDVSHEEDPRHRRLHSKPESAALRLLHRDFRDQATHTEPHPCRALEGRAEKRFQMLRLLDGIRFKKQPCGSSQRDPSQEILLPLLQQSAGNSQDVEASRGERKMPELNEIKVNRGKELSALAVLLDSIEALNGICK